MNVSIKSLMPLLSITLLFAACQKDITVKEQITNVDQVSSSDATVASEFPNCKLRRIYQSYGPGNATLNELFTYNKAGNPVSVVSSDNSNSSYFFYDKQNRLIAYETNYPGGFADSYYTYDSNNRIIIDTTIVNGKGGPYEQSYAIKLTYDSQGRIVKENIKNYHSGPGLDGPPLELRPDRNPTYTYDARGNLGVSGWKSSSYDNKVSIFRSHPIFQFIFRNYSRNNSSVQAKYNSLGLPLTVVPGNAYFFALTNVDKAIYDCN